MKLDIIGFIGLLVISSSALAYTKSASDMVWSGTAKNIYGESIVDSMHGIEVDLEKCTLTIQGNEYVSTQDNPTSAYRLIMCDQQTLFAMFAGSECVQTHTFSRYGDKIVLTSARISCPEYIGRGFNVTTTFVSP